MNYITRKFAYLKICSFILLAIYTLITCGCSQEVQNVCSTPDVIQKLNYDFGYEVASNTNLPQIEFSNFKIMQSQNLVTYCRARAEIRGDATDLTNVLLAKLGSKNFKSKEVLLKKQDPVKMTQSQINQLYPYLAVFYLLRYKHIAPPFKKYDIVMQVDYTVNNQNHYLTGVNYNDDIFRIVFRKLAADIESSSRDLSVISVLKR